MLSSTLAVLLLANPGGHHPLGRGAPDARQPSV